MKKKIYFIHPLQGNVFPHSVVFTHITHTGYTCRNTEDIHAHTQPHADRRSGRAERLPGTRHQGSSFEVRCLAQGHLGSGLGGELAPLQLPAHSILCFLVQSGREPATLWFQDQVPTDWATAASMYCFYKIVLFFIVFVNVSLKTPRNVGIGVHHHFQCSFKPNNLIDGGLSVVVWIYP